ncbi:hypothetical protein BGZ83_009037, partial [Gryganskiella cystojenkinii]
MTSTEKPAESFKSLFGQRLEPYLALSKSAKGAGCVQLIKDVLAAPGVMVFGELLDMPNVVELKSHPEHSRYHRLLEIFAYGTFQDYQQNKASLPEITEIQRTKLQQLSIVSLSEQTRALPYNDLLTYLEIANVRQLEDLIMDAIYQNVINASLDQKLKLVEIHSAMGRDLRPGQAEVMVRILNDWTKTSEALLQTLSAKMAQVKDNYEKDKLAREAFEKEVEKMKRDSTSSGSGKGRKMGPGNANLMDYEMSDHNPFQSPEFSGEYERTMFGSKSWHVYNRENVAQVKRDEAQAAEEQARIDERADSADREYRLQVLRDRAKRQYSNAVVDVARDNVVHDEDMRKEPDTTIEILQEKSERAAITQKQHINFWPDLENTTKSVANQTFKKTPKEHEKQRLAGYDKKGQMGEPLGSVVKGPAPWYQQPNAGVMTASEQKGQEHQSSKLREDPLQMVNSMLGKKKEMTEKRRGTSPVKLNKKIRLSEHKVLGTRVDSPDEVKNGMSMMVKLRMERMEREREEHRKARALYAPTREDSEDGSFYNQQFNPEATKIAHRHTLYSSSTNTRSGAKEYDPQNDRKQSREQNDGRHRDHDQSQGRISGHGDRKERDEGRDRDRDKSRNSSSKHRDDHRDEHR